MYRNLDLYEKVCKFSEFFGLIPPKNPNDLSLDRLEIVLHMTDIDQDLDQSVTLLNRSWEIMGLDIVQMEIPYTWLTLKILENHSKLSKIKSFTFSNFSSELIEYIVNQPSSYRIELNNVFTNVIELDSAINFIAKKISLFDDDYFETMEKDGRLLLRAFLLSIFPEVELFFEKNEISSGDFYLLFLKCLACDSGLMDLSFDSIRNVFNLDFKEDQGEH